MQKFVRVNEKIRSPEVRVIGANSEQLGVLPVGRALELAYEQSLDLVEVAPMAVPPVCRIIDYSKYKYDQEKKERRVKKTQHKTHLKQIRLKPHIDDHDYQVKLKQTIAFLEKKDKVKLNMFFRGREMSFQEQGRKVLERLVADTVEHSIVEKNPVLEGRVMSVLLAPKSAK